MNLIRVVAILTIFLSKLSFACASCGSGGGSPLVLYPNENQKFLFGLSRQTNIQEISTQGEFYNPTIKHRDQTLIAGGFQIRRQVQFILAMPYITNRTSDGRQFSAVGDYSLGFKYNIVQQSFINPNLPQIQLQLDHKPDSAKSVFDYERIDGLDVTGSGVASTTVGVDIWWGMRTFMYGGSISTTASQPRTSDGRIVQRGVARSVVGTLGYLLSAKNLLTSGIAYTSKTSDSDSGKAVVNSESRRGDVFIALRFKPIPLEEWRIAYRINGFQTFNNYNTSHQHSISATYAKVL